MPDAVGIEQGRAAFAYAKVIEVKEKHKACEKEYKGYVKNVPMLIKVNGLGAAFAFIQAKSKGTDNRAEAYRQIYNQTFEWLKHQGRLHGEDLIDDIIKQKSVQYRVVTVEVLALFNWLRRFVDGLIEGEGTE